MFFFLILFRKQFNTTHYQIFRNSITFFTSVILFYFLYSDIYYLGIQSLKMKSLFMKNILTCEFQTVYQLSFHFVKCLNALVFTYTSLEIVRYLFNFDTRYNYIIIASSYSYNLMFYNYFTLPINRRRINPRDFFHVICTILRVKRFHSRHNNYVSIIDSNFNTDCLL